MYSFLKNGLVRNATFCCCFNGNTIFLLKAIKQVSKSRSYLNCSVLSSLHAKSSVLLKFNFRNTRQRACIGAAVLLGNGFSVALCCGARRWVHFTRPSSTGAALVRAEMDSARASKPPDVMIELLPHCFPCLCQGDERLPWLLRLREGGEGVAATAAASCPNISQGLSSPAWSFRISAAVAGAGRL